jgi:hypothetical protein
MNLLEWGTSIAMSSIIIGVTGNSLWLFQKAYQQKLHKQQEASEVMYAFHIISRSIRQAGFPAVAMEFPKMKPKNKGKNSSRTSFKSSNKSSTLPALAIKKNSGLSSSSLGEFVFRKGVHTVNDSDAMVIRHAAYGHFDCLGHRLTEKRLDQKIAYQGFFTQTQGSGKNRTGTLMCQSLDNKGHIQNDGILSGIKRFEIYQDVHPHKKLSNMPISIIEIEVEMNSGETYSLNVEMRHANTLL